MSVGHDDLCLKAAKLAAAAAALKQASGTDAPFSLAFLADRRRIPDPEPILHALPAGAAVIYRDHDDPQREGIARRYASICKSRGVLFLVAGDLALARAVHADGVHWPSRHLHRAPEGRVRDRPSPHAPASLSGEASEAIAERVRGRPSNGERGPLTRKSEDGFSTSPEGEVKGRPLLITAACHDAEELRRARDIGADLALLSPVFTTKSHPCTEHLGRARFKALAAASPIPVLALGGVDATNAMVLRGRNVVGFGAIGAFGSQ